MVYGVWFMVYGVWCMVYGVGFMRQRRKAKGKTTKEKIVEEYSYVNNQIILHIQVKVSLIHKDGAVYLTWLEHCYIFNLIYVLNSI